MICLRGIQLAAIYLNLIATVVDYLTFILWIQTRMSTIKTLKWEAFFQKFWILRWKKLLLIMSKNVFSPKTHELNTKYIYYLLFFLAKTVTQQVFVYYRDILKSEAEAFAVKIKHLIKFGETVSDKWVYSFVYYPRFRFWVYNIFIADAFLVNETIF